MPSKIFVFGFAAGVCFTLIMAIAFFGIFSGNNDLSVVPLPSEIHAASNPVMGKVITASNLDSRDGLSEIEKMRYALEKIVSELDTIGDRIYNLNRPIDKIADKMR